jgi:hypothetical protein
MHKYRSLFAWQQAHQAAVLTLTKCLTRLAAEVRYLPETTTNELAHLLERSMAALHGLIRKIQVKT